MCYALAMFTDQSENEYRTSGTLATKKNIKLQTEVTLLHSTIAKLFRLVVCH